MKRICLILSMLFTIASFAAKGENIRIGFTRTGTTAASVSTSITTDSDIDISSATATFACTHSLKGTAGNITQSIICPDVNGNTSPTIKLTFTIDNLPDDFSFNKIGLDIHALNSSSAYQEPSDGVVRQWNIATNITQGSTSNTFGTLSNIDIAAGVGTAGNVHKTWNIESTTSYTTAESTTIELTITKGTTNLGCFFGLSEITLSKEEETTTPPVTGETKIYTISWKNTGGNYITEGNDGSMYISDYNVTERQFWEFIPTGNTNCYYIKNTATGNYIESCNKTPSSASKIQTTSTPVEYYVAQTTATNENITGCYYLSSTDCEGYDNEESGPRALNKDGASNFIITWQAGTSRVGSYWKLTETEDLYEIRPFNPSAAIGSIETSYNIGNETKNITLSEGSISLLEKEINNKSQMWYFIGSSNKEGYLIASTKEPYSTIEIVNGEIRVTTDAATRWKVYAEKDQAEKYYFKSIADGQTLIIDGDSLFTFSKSRSSYAQSKQIYNNPCGYLAENYITNAKLAGADALETITYETSTAPSDWHILYTADRGTIGAGGEFTLNITLAQTANEYLEIHAYFDWDADGIFETSQQMETTGNTSSATFNAPEDAAMTTTRMRVRVNENALNLAEDDVEGVVYDFIISVAPAMEKRTVTTSTNAKGRGTVQLSHTADTYDKGTTLTATATAANDNSFICWKEGNIIVSTEAEYTFTVDHNINLTAYFSPDTKGSDDIITEIKKTDTTNNSITIKQCRGYIQANSNDKITSITIYNSNATQVATTKSDKIATQALSKGIYIIKVRTVAGEKNFKIHNNF